jgi:Fic family protein
MSAAEKNSSVWNVFNFDLNMDWNLVEQLRVLDRFDASWSLTEEREGGALKELRTMATVQSVGSSTRIEGAKLPDEQVDALIRNLTINTLDDRDRQEVIGYYETLELILTEYPHIRITESEVKGLHGQLLRHVEKDSWHRGQYKLLSNQVEARLPDGSRQIIFQTTPHGFATDDAMRALFEWYQGTTKMHPFVKIAAFVYEFLSIHPFQDGNGRMSRLLTNLLLLQHGYTWAQYVSLEHEIERRKKDYYQALRQCQAQRPHENITPWIAFFLEVLERMTQNLLAKLKRSGISTTLSERERALLLHIAESPGVGSGKLARRTKVPLPTVKRLLAGLLHQNLIRKSGAGRATGYFLT